VTIIQFKRELADEAEGLLVSVGPIDISKKCQMLLAKCVGLSRPNIINNIA